MAAHDVEMLWALARGQLDDTEARSLRAHVHDCGAHLRALQQHGDEQLTADLRDAGDGELPALARDVQRDRRENRCGGVLHWRPFAKSPVVASRKSQVASRKSQVASRKSTVT